MNSWKPTPTPQMVLMSSRMRRCFSRSVIRHFRFKSRCEFQFAKEKGITTISGIKAFIDDPSVDVSLIIRFGRGWMFVPPRVMSNSKFIRKHGDWHHYIANNGEMGMCYVHPVEWFERNRELFRSNASPFLIASRAAKWISLAIDDLTYKHFLGWQSGLDEWPREWIDWRHDQAGIEQYFYEKKRNSCERIEANSREAADADQ